MSGTSNLGSWNGHWLGSKISKLPAPPRGHRWDERCHWLGACWGSVPRPETFIVSRMEKSALKKWEETWNLRQWWDWTVFFDSICMFMWDLAGIGDAVWFDSSEDFREKVVAYHLIQRVPANVVNGWLMGLLPYRRGKFSKWPWYPSKFAAIIYPRSEQSLSNVGWKPNIKASS